MKITIKNETNMITYSNIPESADKVPFTWNNDNYKYTEPNEKNIHTLTFEQIESKVKIVLTPQGRYDGVLLYRFLDKVISGVKLDKPLTQDTDELPSYICKGETTNKYLIDLLNKKDKIHLYVNYTGNLKKKRSMEIFPYFFFNNFTIQ